MMLLLDFAVEIQQAEKNPTATTKNPRQPLQ